MIVQKRHTGADSPRP